MLFCYLFGKIYRESMDFFQISPLLRYWYISSNNPKSLMYPSLVTSIPMCFILIIMGIASRPLIEAGRVLMPVKQDIYCHEQNLCHTFQVYQDPFGEFIGMNFLQKEKYLSNFDMSHVTSHLSHVTFFFYKVVKLVSGGSITNGAYPIQFLNNYEASFYIFYI